MEETGEAPLQYEAATSDESKPVIPPKANQVDSNASFEESGASPTREAAVGTLTMDEAHGILSSLLQRNKLSGSESAALNLMVKEYDGMKDKVTKLKSLLGRSAKAQRESKVELDASQKRLHESLKEIERLNKKIDKLATRPTHMELLADFETNFDRALLSVGKYQAGGEDTAPPSVVPATTTFVSEPSVDGLLMQELADARERTDKLEHLNSILNHRLAQMENETKEHKRLRDEMTNKITHLELEKRMAVMEAEHTSRMMYEKAASLEEMQLEIELLTKASVRANQRASHDEELLKAVKTDKQHVQEMEARVQALQEWALASSEAKQVAQERVRILETQLRLLQKGQVSLQTSSNDSSERILQSNSGSLVVGAGDVGFRIVALTPEQKKSVQITERVFLRWQFDLTTEDVDVLFSILKSSCETVADRRKADCIVKNRHIKGGAAGEADNAFSIQGACTLVWSNEKSWLRPRTVRYTVEAVVVPD